MTGWSSSSKRIVLVSSLLGGGGAERVLLTMAEWWRDQGHDVTIIVLRGETNGGDYAVPEGIAVRRLSLIEESNPLASGAHVGRLAKLRRALLAEKPDVVMSFIDKLNVAVIFALWGTGVPVIATEHLAPWRNPLGSGWEMMRWLAYRHATAVVSPTPSITMWFARHGACGVTLPYPARFVRSRAADDRDARVHVIIGAGRLVPQKGFDLLIGAFARIAERHPGWSLEIAGEGPLRAELEQQAKRVGLGARVAFPGFVSDLAARLRRSAVFALSSRHEAYPMVLCEAMAAGCCVVAADCPTGPREILAGGERGGVLVPTEDEGALAAALHRVLGDTELRGYLSRRAREAAEALGPEATMRQWDDCFRELLAVHDGRAV